MTGYKERLELIEAELDQKFNEEIQKHHQLAAQRDALIEGHNMERDSIQRQMVEHLGYVEGLDFALRKVRRFLYQ